MLRCAFQCDTPPGDASSNLSLTMQDLSTSFSSSRLWVRYQKRRLQVQIMRWLSIIGLQKARDGLLSPPVPGRAL